MKMRYLLVALLLMVVTSKSQVRDTLFLWPGNVPGETELKHLPVQTPDTHNNVIRLTNITDPFLLVYEAPDSLKNRGAVIISPGGAYQYIAVNIEGFEIAEWFNQLGYTAFVHYYRNPQKQEGAFQDIQRAVRLVRGNSEKWGIDKNRIGVIGFSAGGNLSARAATGFDKTIYEQVDEYDSISARPDFAILIYPAYLDGGENGSLTPGLTLNENTPPIFLFGTADDKYSSGSIVMAKSLKDKNLPFEFHMLANGGHGYGKREENVAGETWPKLAEIWLRKLLR